MEEELKQRPCKVLKIVLFGPESTGKTTLAKMLARHYNTHWVPEYMREYLQEKWDLHKQTCEPRDLLPIARGQMRTENKLAQTANQVLFCDTNLLVLKIYSEIYYNGFCEPELLKYALNNWYDLYFLTNIDTPWVADDLRDKPHDREGMFKSFKDTLLKNNHPFVILNGNLDQRMQTAITAIDELLKQQN